jgi:hypothetical protein
LPEFKPDNKKRKEKIPEFVFVPESVDMGTLPIYILLDRSIDHFDHWTHDLESIVEKYPSNSSTINPTVDSIRELRDRLSHSLGDFLIEKKPELERYEKSVQNYEKLITDPKVEESQIQTFLESNPHLINHGITQIIPKKSFGGEKYPDFVGIVYDGSHILIEIENPRDMIYRKDGSPSAKFSHAEQQVRDYLHWLNRDPDYLRKRGLPSISAENTRGLLIIGMSRDLRNEEKEKLMQHNFSVRSSHVVRTFDEILVENQKIISSIRKQ